MSQRCIALVTCVVTVRGTPHYYREGVIAEFPEDFKLPVGKAGDPYFQKFGVSKEADPESAAERAQIDQIAKENKLGAKVLETIFEEAGAKNSADKLNALIEFVSANQPDARAKTREEKAASK